MEHMLETLQNSPYAWAALSLIAVISLILAIYFGISSKKVKRFYYFKKTNKLVSFNSNKPSSLHLFYDDTEIQDVSVTRIAVWNSGNEVINAEDLVESEPLSIKIIEGKKEDVKILDTSVEYVTDETNRFKFLACEDSKVEDKEEDRTNKDVVNFDYAGKHDGFILQIIHTGDPASIYLDCRIKGGQDICEIDSRGRKQYHLRDGDWLYSFLSKQKYLFARGKTIENYPFYEVIHRLFHWWISLVAFTLLLGSAYFDIIHPENSYHLLKDYLEVALFMLFLRFLYYLLVDFSRDIEEKPRSIPTNLRKKL